MKLLVINEQGETVLEGNLLNADVKVIKEEEPDFYSSVLACPAKPRRHRLDLGGILVGDDQGRQVIFYHEHNRGNVLFSLGDTY